MSDVDAADWLLRLQSEDVPQAEVDAWVKWSQAEPRNLDAFDRMQALYEGLLLLGESVRRDLLRLAADPESVKAVAGKAAQPARRARSQHPVPQGESDAQRLRRLEQTAQWLQRLYEKAGDDGVVEAWLDWCQADPRNQQAFDELAVIWEMSGEIVTQPHARRQ
jgi:ferric-dicitrate binding protein FerR (iron transport regulator)